MKRLAALTILATLALAPAAHAETPTERVASKTLNQHLANHAPYPYWATKRAECYGVSGTRRWKCTVFIYWPTRNGVRTGYEQHFFGVKVDGIVRSGRSFRLVGFKAIQQGAIA